MVSFSCRKVSAIAFFCLQLSNIADRCRGEKPQKGDGDAYGIKKVLASCSLTANKRLANGNHLVIYMSVPVCIITW